MYFLMYLKFVWAVTVIPIHYNTSYTRGNEAILPYTDLQQMTVWLSEPTENENKGKLKLEYKKWVYHHHKSEKRWPNLSKWGSKKFTLLNSDS